MSDPDPFEDMDQGPGFLSKLCEFEQAAFKKYIFYQNIRNYRGGGVINKNFVKIVRNRRQTESRKIFINKFLTIVTTLSPKHPASCVIINK